MSSLKNDLYSIVAWTIIELEITASSVIAVTIKQRMQLNMRNHVGSLGSMATCKQQSASSPTVIQHFIASIAVYHMHIRRVT